MRALLAATMAQYVGVERVAFSPDGRWIAAGLNGPNPTLQVWPSQASGNAVTLDAQKVTYGAQTPAFNHDSRWLASFVKGKTLTLWSTTTWTVERTWGLSGSGQALAFAPADSRLAIAADGEAAIWDAVNGRKLVALSSPGSLQANGIAWSPDGRRGSDRG